MAHKRPSFIEIAEAKARFSELVRRAGAGEEIVIVRDQEPAARLISAGLVVARQPGSTRGLFTMAPDSEAPVPDSRVRRRP